MKRWHWTSLLLVGLTLIVGRLLAAYSEEPTYFGRSDFTVFYATAQAAISGENMYGNEKLQQRIEKLRAGEGAVRYLYPPVASLIFFPLTFLPYKAAVWVWFSANLLFSLGTVLVVQKLVGRKLALAHWATITVGLAGYVSFFTALRSGQVNLLLVFLFVVHILAIKQRRHLSAAVLLAGMVLLKIFPIVFLVYYLMKQQYRLVGYSLLSIILLFSVSIPIFGWSVHANYLIRLPQRLTSGITAQGLSRYENPTLNGWLHRVSVIVRDHKYPGLFNYDRKNLQHVKRYNAGDITWIQRLHWVVSGLLFLGLVWLTFIKRHTTEYLTELTLWLGYIFLAAKDAHVQYFVAFIPFFLYVLVAKPAWLPPWPQRSYSWLVLAFLLLSFSASQILPYVYIPDWLLVVPVALIGNSILLGYIVFYYLRQGQPPRAIPA